jgi:sulfite reductase alpha subunit-like flavoprotein
VVDLGTIKVADLFRFRRVVFAVSTYGRGAPPPSAVDFWTALTAVNSIPDEQQCRFAVLGCGSSAFSGSFAGFAKAIQAKLIGLGCEEVAPLCTRDETDEDGDAKVGEWIAHLSFK